MYLEENHDMSFNTILRVVWGKYKHCFGVCPTLSANKNRVTYLWRLYLERKSWHDM